MEVDEAAAGEAATSRVASAAPTTLIMAERAERAGTTRVVVVAVAVAAAVGSTIAGAAREVARAVEEEARVRPPIYQR